MVTTPSDPATSASVERREEDVLENERVLGIKELEVNEEDVFVEREVKVKVKVKSEDGRDDSCTPTAVSKVEPANRFEVNNVTLTDLQHALIKSTWLSLTEASDETVPAPVLAAQYTRYFDEAANPVNTTRPWPLEMMKGGNTKNSERVVGEP